MNFLFPEKNCQKKILCDILLRFYFRLNNDRHRIKSMDYNNQILTEILLPSYNNWFTDCMDFSFND